MLRSYALTALIALNVVLLAALILAAIPPRTANAQPALSGNYLVVAGEVRDDFDGVYLIDQSTRLLHGFIFDRGRKRLDYAGARDLERDFRNNQRTP